MKSMASGLANSAAIVRSPSFSRSASSQTTTIRAARNQRRQSIIEAALECFTTDGYEPTTVSDLRRRAHVTAGSLYHYFPGGKAEIAATVHLDCLRRYQEEFLPVLAAAGEDPEAGIRIGVRHHLEWIIAHPRRARFLFSDHPQEVAVA